VCACVKVACVCVCEGCRACVHADGREVSLHRSADKYTCFSLLNAFRLFTRTAVALCKHIYTSAGVFQAVAYSDLTEEDALTFLVVDLHLGPMPPSDQAQQTALQASFAGPWHVAKTSDSLCMGGSQQRQGKHGPQPQML